MNTTKSVYTIAMMWFAALVLSLATSSGGEVRAQKPIDTTPTLTAQEKKLFADFDRRVKDYLAQRKAVAKQLPSLSKEATPAEIEAYQKNFVERLRAMRAGTKPGYIFIPAFTTYVRQTIQTEFPPKDKAEIKQTAMEAEKSQKAPRCSLAQAEETRARARAAGRKYPNLVDNMAVARKRTTKRAKRKRKTGVSQQCRQTLLIRAAR